jgi:poly(A)-specific ribonuclease
VTLTSESPEGTNQQSLVANLFTEEQKKAYVDGQMDKFHAKIGFRRIFKELVRSKKPVIGHNCMYDFMFVFQAFHEELP